jgi:hypothetical protein
MANEPLQNFRAVEPANYGFGASATIASQPFVLNHCSVTESGTATPIAGAALTFNAGITGDTNRFLPWVSRTNTNQETTGAYFPVKVPNAYDRIYIFPMYCTSTDAEAENVGIGAGTLTGPYVIPMGLAPQTRGFSTSNKLNDRISRVPDDILAKEYPDEVYTTLDSRTNGIWNPLLPYSSNFSTSSGAWNVTGTNNPTSFGRASYGATPSVGSGYQLPPDFTISVNDGGAFTSGDSALVNPMPFITGVGIEYQTMGAEEIVCCLGAPPTGFTRYHPSTTGKQYTYHWFTMGMFLG